MLKRLGLADALLKNAESRPPRAGGLPRQTA